MTPPENIENLVKHFCDEKTSGMETSAELDERTLKAAREAQKESTAEHTATASDLWKTLPGRNTPKLAAAALMLIAVLLGLHHFTGPIEIATPALSDVVRNILSQKWVYMFAEDRKRGQITAEYWYSPAKQQIYLKYHDDDGTASFYDIPAGLLYEYRDGIITIRQPESLDYDLDRLEERLPVLGNLLSRYESQGADIVQTETLYNSRPALLYEIELSLPDDIGRLPGSDTQLPAALRTRKYSWLVDKNTHLPIICVHLDILEMLRDGEFQPNVMRSQRYAFDYSDTGPQDIYDLGVPRDTEVVDERPDPQIQELLDKINQIKRTKYSSFAVVVADRGVPQRVIIRDGRKLREERVECRISRSDPNELKKYGLEMGDTFDSIYKWLGESDAVRRRDIAIMDGQFRYETSQAAIDVNRPVTMSRWRSVNEDFTYNYCWRTPRGQVVTTPYSTQNGLICTLNNDRYCYYDPAKEYMCVRTENADGDVTYEIAEFGRTSGGMWYPSLARRGGYTERAGVLELVGLSDYHLYATDLDDQLKATLDPNGLPNYVEPRELMRRVQSQGQEAAQDDSPVEYTGFTPLHMAIYRQDIKKVTELLKEGAEVEPAYDTGATPMELAIASGNLEMVKLLHAHGADFTSNDDEQRDALGLAAEEGLLDVVQFMLDQGSDVNVIYKNQCRPLHYAAGNGDLAMAELLLANGAEVSPLNRQGRTPLYTAIDRLGNRMMNTPVDQAVVEGYQDVIMLLIDRGADINMRIVGVSSEKNALSRLLTMFSAFSSARDNAEQQIDFLRFLLKLGADPNGIATGGINASLYRILEEGRYDIAKVLLDGGADPWLVGDADMWPFRQHNLLYFARRKNDDKLHDLLYPYMKDRFERTNNEILAVASQVLAACMEQDTAAISNLCIDHPDYYTRSWESWSKQIRESYQEHEDLFDQIIPGWFTLDGLAEVYIPLPEGTKEKSTLLGFIQYPDGQWKCISYEKLTYMQAYPGWFVNRGWILKEFRNRIYEQFGIPEQIETRGNGLGTLHGKFSWRIVLTAQQDALRVDYEEERMQSQYSLLTPAHVKRYRGNKLTVYTREYVYAQKDHPQRLIFRPQTLIVENGDSVHTFTVDNGQVLLTHGKQKTRADRFVFDLATYQVVSPQQ